MGCSWASCVPLQWNVVFGRCLRWNWLWFRDKLVKGSARPHTTSAYQGIFTCYASQKSCFTQDEVLCGRIGSHFPPRPYKKEKSKVVRSEAQTEATHLLNLIHSPPSSPWRAKPQTSVFSFRPLTSTTLTVHITPFLRLPSFTFPSRGLMSWESEDEMGKASMPEPHEAWHRSTWKQRYSTGMVTKTTASVGHQWKPGPLFHVPGGLPKLSIYVCERKRWTEEQGTF